MNLIISEENEEGKWSQQSNLGKNEPAVDLSSMEELTGITNDKAIATILDELQGLLQQREQRIHISTPKFTKKAIVAFKYLVNPISLLSFVYIVLTFLSVDYEELRGLQEGPSSKDRQQDVEKLLSVAMIILLMAFDLILQINRVDYQVLEIDNKIKTVLEVFKSVRTGQAESQIQRQRQFSKEFSFYKDNCFTYAMRGGPGNFMLVPNNTLAKDDIIKLMPGDIAPALIEIIPYDIEIDEQKVQQQGSRKTMPISKKKIINVPNEFTGKQKEFYNKGTRFTLPESYKPDWQKLQQDHKSDSNLHSLFRDNQELNSQSFKEKSIMVSNLKQPDNDGKKTLKHSGTSIAKRNVLKSPSRTAMQRAEKDFPEQKLMMSERKLVQGKKRKASVVMKRDTQMTRSIFSQLPDTGLKSQPQFLELKEHKTQKFKPNKKQNFVEDPFDLELCPPLKGKKERASDVGSISIEQVELREKFNKEEINKEFRRNLKKYFLFRVKKTPCIQDLAEFITFNTDLSKRELSSLADNNKDNLIYYKNKRHFLSFVLNVSYVLWSFCLISDLTYYFIFRAETDRFQVSNSQLVMMYMNFVIPILVQVEEAWSNSVIHSLLDILQVSDYNKNFNSSLNQPAGDFPVSKQRKPTKEELLKRRRNKFTAQQVQQDRMKSCWMWLRCRKMQDSGAPEDALSKDSQGSHFVRFAKSSRGNTDQTSRAESSKSKRKRHSSKLSRDIKPDSFYEETDFENRNIFDNLSKFWQNLRAGIFPNNNIMAQMASVTIFAFVDKQGIVTESQKYIDEVALINKKGEKTVLDLQHNTLIKREERIYEFEEKQKFRENIDALKALGLAFMLARNPKLTDSANELQEMFLMDHLKLTSTDHQLQQSQIDFIDNTKIREKIDKESGFQFHTVLKQETETIQDCVCSLARLIGHTDRSFQQYRIVKQFWNIKRNQDIQKSNKRDEIINKDPKFEVGCKKIHQSASESIDTHNELKLQQSLLDISVKEADIQNNPLIFVDFKLMKIQERKRQAGFCHILTSIIQEVDKDELQSFSRGEASVIFNDCTDYWDGEKIEHISDKMRTQIKAILAQWTEQCETIGFSYKPVDSQFKTEVLDELTKGQGKCVEEDEQKRYKKDEKRKQKMREVQQNQIFLGFLALKHHVKKEVKTLVNTLTTAGIRGVLFSSEDILKTKAMASDVGIDTGWNSWVSLEDNPEEKITNWDGNFVLPYGIEAIKKHIEKVDPIPLQVQIFCKANPQRTKDMFNIYQENKEVVACLGNIMNSANLKIFMQANVSIGMGIEPSFRCKRCNGRITIEHKNSQMLKDQNLLDESDEPSILEYLSSQLTALACDFVFRANTNVYCIYPAFREARRLKQGLEYSALMSVTSYFIIFLSCFFSEVVLGIDSQARPLLTRLQLLFLILIIIPLLCLLCLARSWTLQDLMGRSVLNQRFKEQMPYQLQIVSYTKLQVFYTAICITAVRLINLYFTECHDKEGFKTLRGLLWTQYSHPPQLQPHEIDETHFNFCVILLFLSFVQIGKESSLVTIREGFFKGMPDETSEMNSDLRHQGSINLNNIYFMRAILSQILLAIVYMVVVPLVKFGSVQDAEVGYSEYLSSNLPHYSSWIATAVLILLLLLYEENQKIKIKEQYEIDGKMLNIFFTTRLGMWSPR